MARNDMRPSLLQGGVESAGLVKRRDEGDAPVDLHDHLLVILVRHDVDVYRRVLRE